MCLRIQLTQNDRPFNAPYLPICIHPQFNLLAMPTEHMLKETAAVTVSPNYNLLAITMQKERAQAGFESIPDFMIFQLCHHKSSLHKASNASKSPYFRTRSYAFLPITGRRSRCCASSSTRPAIASISPIGTMYPLRPSSMS